jgi:hypothetical protein
MRVRIDQACYSELAEPAVKLGMGSNFDREWDLWRGAADEIGLLSKSENEFHELLSRTAVRTAAANLIASLTQR